MDDEGMAYGGWAIIDFKKEAIKAGETPQSMAGEISVSMLGGVAMLRILAPAVDGRPDEDHEWATTLIAHIKHTDEAEVMAYLARPRGRRAKLGIAVTHRNEDTADAG